MSPLIYEIIFGFVALWLLSGLFVRGWIFAFLQDEYEDHAREDYADDYHVAKQLQMYGLLSVYWMVKALVKHRKEIKKIWHGWRLK